MLYKLKIHFISRNYKSFHMISGATHSSVYFVYLYIILPCFSQKYVLRYIELEKYISFHIF